MDAKTTSLSKKITRTRSSWELFCHGYYLLLAAGRLVMKTRKSYRWYRQPAVCRGYCVWKRGNWQIISVVAECRSNYAYSMYFCTCIYGSIREDRKGFNEYTTYLALRFWNQTSTCLGRSLSLTAKASFCFCRKNVAFSNTIKFLAHSISMTVVCTSILQCWEVNWSSNALLLVNSYQHCIMKWEKCVTR